MRKTPLRPSTKRMTRNTPVRARNPERRAAEHERCYGEHGAYIRAQPCAVQRKACWGRIEAAHTENGGMGRKADASTLAPLCACHHLELHAHGSVTFATKYRIDLSALAADLWQRSPANPGYGCDDCAAEGRVCEACVAEREQEREAVESWRLLGERADSEAMP
jgi:hypothetical protein